MTTGNVSPNLLTRRPRHFGNSYVFYHLPKFLFHTFAVRYHLHTITIPPSPFMHVNYFLSSPSQHPPTCLSILSHTSSIGLYTRTQRSLPTLSRRVRVPCSLLRVPTTVRE